MNKTILENLIKKDIEIKSKISKFEHKRYLFEQIYLERPFKSILGLRGVGKTTLLVQLALKNKGFYISLDDIALKSIDLLELLKEINEMFSIDYFVLDEIQSLENWEFKIKDIYELTDFNIVFSGSSLINILERSVDLSRRVITFEIPPLSFREYLLFKKNINIKTIKFEEIFDKKILNKKILEISQYKSEFDNYIKCGAYPFAISNKTTIDSFKNILNKTLYSDFVKVRNLNEEDIQMTLKILIYISSGSDEISYTSLSNTLGVSKTKVISLIELLEKSMLVIKIYPKVLGKTLLKIHPKYSMLLPLRFLINEIYGLKTDIGDLREDMFMTSLFLDRNCIYFLKSNSKQPDFMYKNYVFEIGGVSKSSKQIKNIENSYIIKDSLITKNNEIPLIIFGFLY